MLTQATTPIMSFSLQRHTCSNVCLQPPAWWNMVSFQHLAGSPVPLWPAQYSLSLPSIPWHLLFIFLLWWLISPCASQWLWLALVLTLLWDSFPQCPLLHVAVVPAYCLVIHGLLSVTNCYETFECLDPPCTGSLLTDTLVLDSALS